MSECNLDRGANCYCRGGISSFVPLVPMSQKVAVLLLAHGTPERPDQVPEYMGYITGGRPVPPQVIEEVRHRYSIIGHSPLTCWTMRQADLLSQTLNVPVFAAMRNWRPFIRDVVRDIVSGGYERVIAICLAPQNSRTSVGLYRRAVVGDTELPFELDFVEQWHDHPRLISAFADKLSLGLKTASAESGKTPPVIFTAHSVPERTITEGDPYSDQAKETAALVAKEAGLQQDGWLFAFQSQGMSGGPWIGPTVEETILSLKEKRHSSVFVQPVGFLCDHVEVLYDIDIAFKDFAGKEGVQLWRAASLNGSPLLTEALAELVRERM
jgi:protoporphyrin/coproporphyrin ferrochelatase